MFFCSAKFIVFSIMGAQLCVIKASNIHSVSSRMLTKIFSASPPCIHVCCFVFFCYSLSLGSLEQSRLQFHFRVFFFKSEKFGEKSIHVVTRYGYHFSVHHLNNTRPLAGIKLHCNVLNMLNVKKTKNPPKKTRRAERRQNFVNTFDFIDPQKEIRLL